ncbi:MAG: tol-pal system protein YbgF [Candidatus Eisenbacteria bacterium]|uniref:Tol-pal system protein YbgF n=1 Tax=Eiseniibacteriota bacterium TaxID=2212470 RepID=A0A7Y2EDX2_UNCEI|nr:tol-pal system protein YbgF [Candidatus Eisenbacteria bacterium]
MNKSMVWGGILIGSSCLFQGCVGAFFSQPTNVEITRSEVEALRKEQQEILRLLEELKAQTSTQGDRLATMQADGNFTLEELDEKFSTIQSQIDDQTQRFEQMQQKVEDEISDRAKLEAELMQGSRAVEELPEGQSAPRIESTSNQPKANELYDAAYRDFSRGNYELAIKGFQELLGYYPDMNLSDNAQYWTAECYYGMGDLETAIKEYLKVRDLFPEGDKVAAATLKTGYAFLRKGDTATAKRYFETVLREFPGSDEADLAGDKLDSLL